MTFCERNSQLKDRASAGPNRNRKSAIGWSTILKRRAATEQQHCTVSGQASPRRGFLLMRVKGSTTL